MIASWPLWALLTLVCIAIQSFYSMLEMALVSLNKVRLQYYVSKGRRRALWVHHMLERPSRLFGTTLLGVNIALQIGSQCSREVYTALNLNPDIAPLTQVFLVLIFAELAPMFAARRYPEHVAMLGIPIIYLSSKIMAPIIWLIGLITAAVNWVIRGPQGAPLSALSREELQHLVEQHGEESTAGAEDRLAAVVESIFTLRRKTAKDIMTDVAELQMLPSPATVGDLRLMLSEAPLTCVPVYYRSIHNIVGLSFPRDLVRIPDNKRVRDASRPPWFITEDMPVLQILKQFRYNGQSVAVVLDPEGGARGLIELDDIVDLLFGREPTPQTQDQPRRARRRPVIERSFPASTLIAEFNQQYSANLKGEEDETLAQAMTRRLGRPPDEGDRVQLGRYLLIVSETSLLGARTIVIQTRR